MEEEDSVEEGKGGEEECVGSCVGWVTQKAFEGGDES